MRRCVRNAAALLALLTLLTGCAKRPREAAEVPSDTVVYAASYPLYALTDLVIGDCEGFQLHCLIAPQDGCLRSYTLSDWDRSLLVNGADVVIAGGCGLESFDEELESLASEHFALIEVLPGLELLDQGGTGEESHFEGENPHLYLSREGCREMLLVLSDALGALYPEASDAFHENAQKASEALSEPEESHLQGEGRSVALMNEALLYPATECGLQIVNTSRRESGDMYADAALDACIQEIQSSGAEAVLLERQAPPMLTDALKQAGLRVLLLDGMSTHAEAEGDQGLIEALQNNEAVIAEWLEEKE